MVVLKQKTQKTRKPNKNHYDETLMRAQSQIYLTDSQSQR